MAFIFFNQSMHLCTLEKHWRFGIYRKRFISALLPALMAWGSICEGDESYTGRLPLLEEIFPQLRTVIDIAVRSSPMMTIESIRVSQMEANRKVRASVLYPDLYFSTDMGGRRRDIASASSNDAQLRYNVSLIQPLYHWGSLQAEKQIGVIELDLAVNGRVRAYLNLYAQLNSVFLNSVVQNQAVKKAQMDKDLSAQRLESAQKQMDSGDLPSGEFQEQTFAHQEREIELRRATQTLENLRLRFSMLAGLDEEFVLRLPSEIPPVQFDLRAAESLIESYRGVIGEQSLELQSLLMQKDIEEENLTIHQNRLKPNVNIIARSLQDEETIAADLAGDLERRELFAGINIDWHIFDGRASKGRKELTLERIRERQTEYELALERILISLQNLNSNLKLDFDLADISNQRYLWQKKIYSQKEKDYTEGLISPDAFANEQIRLEQKRLNAFRNRANLYETLTFLLVQVQYTKILERL